MPDAPPTPLRSTPPRSTPPRWWLIAPAALLWCLCASSGWGPGSSPDSASYVIAAQRIAEGLPPLKLDGQPFTAWPPLFPLVMALLNRCGLPLLEAGRWTNALCFAGIVAGTARLALRRGAWAAASAMALLGSPALLQVCATLWSEPLMMLASALSLCAISGPGRPAGRAAGAGAALGLGWLARHAGAVQAGVSLLWWLWRGGDGAGARLRMAALLAASAISGPLAWAGWLEWSGSGRARGDSAVGAAQNATDLAGSFADAILGDPGTPAAGLLIWLAAVFAGLAWSRRDPRPELNIPAIWLLIWPVFLVVAASNTVVAYLGVRFAAPMLPALALLLAEGVSRLRRPALCLIVVIPLAINAASGLLLLRSAGVGGISAPIWQEARLLRGPAGDPADDPAGGGCRGPVALSEAICSNRPDLPALAWGRPVASAPQRHPFRRPHRPTADLERFRAQAARGPIWLLWFRRGSGADWSFYTPTQLQEAGFALEVAGEDRGAGIILYRILPSPGAPPR